MDREWSLRGGFLLPRVIESADGQTASKDDEFIYTHSDFLEHLVQGTRIIKYKDLTTGYIPWRSTISLRPCADAQVTALVKYGSWPWIKGSPGPTSNAQYPIGNRTWLSLSSLRGLCSPKFKAYTPRCGNGLEICFGDPCVPMTLKGAQGRVVVLILTKRPLVDNIRITCVIK